jgi:hypothetical protein
MHQHLRLMSTLLVTFLAVACGSSNNRQLQSITINSTANGKQFQFTASGAFSSPPTSVNPLPAGAWGMGLFAPPPATLQYSLTTQPFVFNCTSSGPSVVSVAAPKDPNAPATGSLPWDQFVTANLEFTCP